MRTRFPLVIALALSLSNCVRSGDGTVDVGATMLRGVRLACALVDVVPDKIASTAPDASAPSSPAAAPSEAPRPPAVQLPPNPFAAMDGGTR